MSEKDNITDVYLSMRKRLAGIVSRMVPPKEVEDIVQETYVRLCKVENKEEIEEPRSFMMKVARNLALDYLKRSETRLNSNTDFSRDFELGITTDLYDETCRNVASGEEFELFCEAVRSLPLQCRRVFVLKKVYGYSQKEISKNLGISENTIEKHVVLGIKRCTQYLIEREVQIKGKRTPSLTVVNGSKR